MDSLNFSVSPSRRTLLALVTDAYGGRGGIATFNRGLLAALATHEEVGKVDVAARIVVEAPGPIPEGVAFHPQSAKGAGHFIRSAIGRAQSADGIVCGHINLLPIAAVVAGWRRLPLILTLHGIDAWDPPHQGLRGTVLHWALPRVDRYVAVSEVTRRRFESWAPVDPSRGQVIPNTYDPGPFSPGPYPTDLARRYGVEGLRVILTLGRLAGLERRKGFDVVLDVLPGLLAVRNDLAYVIAGDGPDRARLEAKANRLGVADRVVFTGYVPEAEKADHYRLADCFAMPSRGEGFGIVLLEAMACGVPVVASAADASREAVREGALGAVVDPADQEAVREAILDALARPKGVPDGLEYFSPARFEERWHGVVNDVFAGLHQPTL